MEGYGGKEFLLIKEYTGSWQSLAFLEIRKKSKKGSGFESGKMGRKNVDFVFGKLRKMGTMFV